MTQIDLQLGHKIRTKRRKLGVTQADLSKKLSIAGDPSYAKIGISAPFAFSSCFRSLPGPFGAVLSLRAKQYVHLGVQVKRAMASAAGRWPLWAV